MTARLAGLPLINTSIPATAEIDEDSWLDLLPLSSITATTPSPNLSTRYIEDTTSGRRVMVLDRPAGYAADDMRIDLHRPDISQAEELARQTRRQDRQLQEQDSSYLIDFPMPDSPNSELLALLSPRDIYDGGSLYGNDAAACDQDEEEAEHPPARTVGRRQGQPYRCGFRHCVRIEKQQFVQDDCEAETQGASNNKRDIETEEISYWPALFRYYLKYPDAHASTTPKLNCAICQDGPLDVAGSSTDQYDERDPAEREQALVLPCGHILGAKCMRSWRSTCQNAKDENIRADRPLKCPLCNFSLVFSECGHIIPGVQIGSANLDGDVDQVPLASRVPPIVPEGGKVPDNCYKCARVAYIIEREELHNRHMAMRDGSIQAMVENILGINDRLRLFGEEYDDMCRLAPSWADLGSEE